MDKQTISERVGQLESLVEELLKDKPADGVIEKKMKALDIEYSEDPIERINRVLRALHPYQIMDLDFEGE